MQVLAPILMLLFLVAGIWNQWIYWTRMYPFMEARGVLPRKWLWPPIWLYKRTCLAENRSLKDWNEYWISFGLAVLAWASFAAVGCIGALNTQPGNEW